jgi:hypothetical protein
MLGRLVTGRQVTGREATGDRGTFGRRQASGRQAAWYHSQWVRFFAQKAFFGFVAKFRVRMTGSEIGTRQAARGWAAGTQAG